VSDRGVIPCPFLREVNVKTASLARTEVARGAVGWGNEATSSVPKIEIDEKAAAIRIRDTRLISSGEKPPGTVGHRGTTGQAGKKKKLVGLTIIIILVAIILAPMSPFGLVLILVIASRSVYGRYRLPSIPGEPQTEAQLDGPARLALRAP
jgi:hypothetical protein